MADFCKFCNKQLPENIRQLRHRASDDTRAVYCDRACQVAHRREKGDFKAMSETGRQKRGQAVARSNRLKPRKTRGAARPARAELP